MASLGKESKKNKQQNGYIVVFALLVLLIVSTIGAALLQTAFLEMKQSEYAFRWEEAMHSCQAGIEGTLEFIHERLSSQAGIEKLPQQACDPGGPYMFSPRSTCSYVIEPDGAVLRSASDGNCTYSFVCTGWSSDALCRIKVTCEYCFDEVYEDDGSGQKRFVKRVFKDRGRVIASEIIL